MVLDGLLEKVKADEVADYYITDRGVEEFKSYLEENNYKLVGDKSDDMDCYPFLDKDYYMFSVIGGDTKRRVVVEGVDFIATI